jgi:hypothetical protein
VFNRRVGAQVLSPFQNHHMQGAAEIKPPFFVLCPSGFRPCVFALGVYYRTGDIH